MAKLNNLLICQRAIISAQNTLTIVDVLEDIGLPPPPASKKSNPANQLPFVPIRFAIVSIWERASKNESERVDARYRLIGPNGKQFGLAAFQIDLSSSQKFRGISESPGFPYQGHGAYIVRAEVLQAKRWKLFGTAHFNVVESPQVH